MDLEVLAQVATRRELPLSDPGVSLAAAGQVANVVELWQKDGCNRGLLMRYVCAAASVGMWDCCLSLARLLSQVERETLYVRSFRITDPDKPDRFRQALIESRPTQ